MVSGDGVDEWDVLDGILALVDKSLVVADETAGATRYRLLETMRQFGSTNLTAAGIDASYRNRYADYYADFVLSRRQQLHGSGDIAALEDIERELENIRVALRQAADDRSSSRFEALFSALFTLWSARGRNSEGASWAVELLGRPDVEPRRPHRGPRLRRVGHKPDQPGRRQEDGRGRDRPLGDHRCGTAARRDHGHESRRHDARPRRSRDRGLRPWAGARRRRAGTVRPRLRAVDLPRGARDLQSVRTLEDVQRDLEALAEQLDNATSGEQLDLNAPTST